MSEQRGADYAVIEITGDVDRPVDEVWPIVGGFFDLDKWLGVPCAAHSGDGGIGSVRRIGDAIVEPMIAATQYSYSYVQTEGPMAPFCYHGTVACEGRGEARATIVYTLVYDQSSMDAQKRASERARIEARFGGAVEAMKRGAGMNAGIPIHSEGGLKLIRDVFARGGFGQGIGRTLGLVGMSADPGVVVLAGDPSEDHQNPLGTVHGGYVATLLDGAMALALQTCLDPGTPYATTDLNINYLRGVKLNVGTVRAEGRVIDLGRSRALAEARLAGPDGQLHAFATGSFSVRR